MKRDFDLLRELLLEVEGAETVDLSDYDDGAVKYHKALLVEAGFVKGKVKQSSRSYTEIPDLVLLQGLTWEGHEFLDQARQRTVWDRAKEHLSRKGIELSLDALRAAMATIIKSTLT